MLNKILEALHKKNDYVSGEEISQGFLISRQALWKYIHELRELGYEIAAVPHLGYKLLASPDRLYSFEVKTGLDTRVMGREIRYYETIPSTMDMAMQLGMQGAPEGLVVVSEAQSKGKGRLGRMWLSPKFKGIYFSLILRPDISPRETPILTLMAAVSVCQAVKNITGLDADIKWPNDIILNNKKTGGILTELNAEMDKVFFVVIGIGINVNNDKKSLCEGAVSLKEYHKESVNRVVLFREILKRIETNYDNFRDHGGGDIIDFWKDHNITLGRRIKVLYQHKTIEGEAVDIDTEGGLLLRNDSGFVERIVSGDIVHCR